MALRITSLLEGFRRAGMAHSKTPTVYPDSRFSAAQLTQLEKEPNILVERVDDAALPSSTEAPASGQVETVAGALGEGENLLAPLMDIIAALDPEDASLWNSDHSPKASVFPKGTTAIDRSNAWEMFKAQQGAE